MSQNSTHRFVVVGAGGIGTWLTAGLVRLLEWKYPGSGLIIVDGDTYEAKNKERQDFTKLGNKAVVKVSELAPQFPNTTIIPVAKWVVADDFSGVSTEDDDGVGKIPVSQLIRENDIVFAVVDNFAARKILFDAAANLANIDVFTGGNDDNLFGSIYHYQKRDGIEITAHPGEFHPEYHNPPDKNPGELSCQDRAEIEGGTQLLATNMAVASFLLGRVQHVLVSNQSPEQTEIFFDLGIGKSEPYNRMHHQHVHVSAPASDLDTPVTV
jgi:molybdopterin/thiamine biosynthesis adenylyltransferase